MALSSLWEHLTPAPNYSLLQGNQFNTKLRNYPPFFIKTDTKLWFRTPQCSGHTKDLGELFWQSPGNARSLVGTHGDPWEAQLGVLPPSRTFQRESGAQTLTQHCRSATKAQSRGSAVPPSVPRWRFLLCRVFTNLTPAWKAANNLTKVFSAFSFSVHAALS